METIPAGPEIHLRLEEVARLIGGELVGDPQIKITGVAGIKEAKKGDITFLVNDKYLPFLRETLASAVITSKDIFLEGRAFVRTETPSIGFAKITEFFYQTKSSHPREIHKTAVVDPSASIGSGVSIGPYVVIEKDVRILDGVTIHAHSFIGARSALGKDSLIYPNVVIREDSQIGERVIIHSGTVIGSDGFGYETVRGEHIKIPQVGFVLIEDDVEIGANVCVDRGRFQKTWIQKGTKIDNLVQIAHNVVIGPNSIIVSQAGISGSTELGKNVVVAGQAGLIGHLSIGDDVVIGAQAGVSKSIPSKSVVLGSPAKPLSEQKRLFALIARLPELFKEFAELKKKIK